MFKYIFCLSTGLQYLRLHKKQRSRKFVLVPTIFFFFPPNIELVIKLWMFLVSKFPAQKYKYVVFRKKMDESGVLQLVYIPISGGWGHFNQGMLSKTVRFIFWHFNLRFFLKISSNTGSFSLFFKFNIRLKKNYFLGLQTDTDCFVWVRVGFIN